MGGWINEIILLNVCVCLGKISRFCRIASSTSKTHVKSYIQQGEWLLDRCGAAKQTLEIRPLQADNLRQYPSPGDLHTGIHMHSPLAPARRCIQER